jgi:hypothetical protein
MLDLNITKKRLFIVGEGSVFDEGIAELLTRGSHLMVSHIIYSDDITFLKIIKRDLPDAILLCETDTLEIESLIDSISIDPIAIGLCILAVRLSNPVIEVYEEPILSAGKISYKRRSIIANTANDLIQMVSGKVG